MADVETLYAIRCEGFGHVEQRSISGYEDGDPVIWVSSKLAYYLCRKPSTSYRNSYDYFFAKARACIEVYRKLSKSSTGNPNLSLDELLTAVTRTLSGLKCFSGTFISQGFVISQGEFIYKQLTGLGETSDNSDQKLLYPSLLLLEVELKWHHLVHQLARLLYEEEQWLSEKKKKNKGSTSSPCTYYIKESSDEHPLSDGLSKEYTFHDWALPCTGTDVTIFGSGEVTEGDGSVCAGDYEVDGMPIYRSAIKEWGIEFGSTYISFRIQTDVTWYRLGRPSKQYVPWFKPVLKTASLAISMINLSTADRAACFTFADVVERASQFEKNNPAYISSCPDIVERYVILHGPIFLAAIFRRLFPRTKEKNARGKQSNLNPCVVAEAVVSKKKAIQATTTRLINRIWGDYYSGYLPTESNEGAVCEILVVKENINRPCSEPRRRKSSSKSKDVKWIGKPVEVHGDEIAVGGALLVEVDRPDELPDIYFVEYMSCNCAFEDAALGTSTQEINANADKTDRARAEDRKRKGLDSEFCCKSLYWPQRGAFLRLPQNEIGLGSGCCNSSNSKKTENAQEIFEIICPGAPKLAEVASTEVKVRRYFRPEDVYPELSYTSDIREVYYYEETHTIPISTIKGKCHVRNKDNFAAQDAPAILKYIFFCENLYDPVKRALKLESWMIMKRLGRRELVEKEKVIQHSQKLSEVCPGSPLAALDIFAGCGGLSAELQQSGISHFLNLISHQCVSKTKWAIEYNEAAAEAFKLNHPESLVFINNCNVIPRLLWQFYAIISISLRSSKWNL
ncbi:hypothetical protein Pfo_011221 [Paulownia fortunei]|nr:hypothetical protein Pfo_011221 [Paulownia fortunei]